MLEVIEPYIPIVTVLLSFAAVYNGIRTRVQGQKIKEQDLALRQLEREDKFRYFPPHLYVKFNGGFVVGDSLRKAPCSITIANRDSRDVLIEEIEWAYSCGYSWKIEDLSFSPFLQKTTDKYQFDIDPDGDLFPYSSGRLFAMIDNILGLSIRVKLSTDDGVLYPIDDIRFKRYLMYRYIRSPIIRKFGVCALCRYHGISMVHAFI
ncbi:hypothetical protein ACEV9B_23025 [Vibrio parahaemolyticus]|uniref:hypothetical protein n=1 Tax=Vibrio parahaemolyticus TaxID=670 RepID=UPI0011720D27|nr:hypothetical protein [Vibrio parahaemolyticus]TOK41345.1 hypothetical protein CGI18_23590 [Vibrio parahaemolyticus]